MCLSSTKYAFKSWYITNLWLIKYDMFLHKICICSLFYGLFRSQIMHDTPIVIHDITNISILSHWNMRIFLYYWYQWWCLGRSLYLTSIKILSFLLSGTKFFLPKWCFATFKRRSKEQLNSTIDGSINAVIFFCVLHCWENGWEICGFEIKAKLLW